jgi:hypothetical protein
MLVLLNNQVCLLCEFVILFLLLYELTTRSPEIQWEIQKINQEYLMAMNSVPIPTDEF